MKRFIIMGLICLTASIVWADQTKFYSPTDDFWITDVSNSKTKEQIKEEFNLTDLPLEITITDLSRYNARYDGSKLYLYDFKAENAQIAADKQTEIEAKIKAKKAELEAAGFTKEQVKLLEELEKLNKK